MFNPSVKSKIQGLFKVFEHFSNTFQGKCNFKGLFKTVLYIQVLFEPLRTLGMHIIMAVNVGSDSMVFEKLNLLGAQVVLANHMKTEFNWKNIQTHKN